MWQLVLILTMATAQPLAGSNSVLSLVDVARTAGDRFAQEGGKNVDLLLEEFKKAEFPVNIRYSWQYRVKTIFGLFSSTKERNLRGDYKALASVMSVMIQEKEIKGFSPGVLTDVDRKQEDAVAAWNVLDLSGKMRKAVILASCEKGALDGITIIYDESSPEV